MQRVVHYKIGYSHASNSSASFSCQPPWHWGGGVASPGAQAQSKAIVQANVLRDGESLLQGLGHPAWKVPPRDV